MDYEGRQRRLQSSTRRLRLSAFLVTHLPNIRYLCGFTGGSGVLIVTRLGSVFCTDGRYTAQAEDEVRGASIVIGRQPAVALAAEWLKTNRRSLKNGAKRAAIVGIEGDHLSVNASANFSRLLGPNFKIRNFPDFVLEQRMLKDAEEIEILGRAATLGSSLFDVLLNSIRPGRRESEVAAELEYAARRAGAEGVSFPTIIASGRRSALPHGQASEAVIPAQGFVVCDFGVILAGYCSDMTRTVHVGSPSSSARRLYQAVRDAQERAVEAVGPGVQFGKIDAAARNVLKKNNLARYFSHSTGHGVGLEIHEPPRLAAGQTGFLEPGMVITIEPGAYLPEKWGVRIEDMAVVTDEGCEVLTPATKDLITL